MSLLHPFRALRPRPDLVERLVCPPYDVISVSEARALHSGGHESFLRVIRPEVDLPVEVDEHADAVYARGAANLLAFAAEGMLVAEDAPSLYVYCLHWRGLDQIGVFACVSVAEYNAARIVRHEMTRVDKEDDRTRHIREQGAHAEPVMLTYRDHEAIHTLVVSTMQQEPLYSFSSFHEVKHTLWRVADAAALVHAFGEVESLYIADGHHRAKAASRASAEMPENAEAAYFPAVLFPMSHMRILPYHRVIRRVPGGVAGLLASLRQGFELSPVTSGEPEHAGEARIVVSEEGALQWYRFVLPQTEASNRAAGLDVARLEEHVLRPLLGIGDARVDTNIAFVGGIRGPGELEKLVLRGEAEVGFAMYATSIHDLIEVSDAGELMPPKSTWFEPKLLSGLLVHRYR